MNLYTFFDSNYICKGIALYLSIQKYTEDYTFYILALDRKCQEILITCNLRNVVVECLDDIITEELQEAKSNRSRAEFCWTCGAYYTDYFLKKYKLKDITYLDSDLMFFNAPQIILEELKTKNASIGLSPHYIKNHTFGKYCAQYVYFKNDNNGSKALHWWRDECVKWCYSKLEDGKYGDQKYLDYMPQLFEGVVDIENRGTGIANWNMEQYQYDFTKRKLKHQGKEWPIVYFHYNGLNVLVKDSCLYLIHSKFFTKEVKNGFIIPYAKLLTEVYRNYLGVNVTKYKYRPLSIWKNIINLMWVSIRNYPLTINMERVYMENKYSERKSPYSERT